MKKFFIIVSITMLCSCSDAAKNSNNNFNNSSNNTSNNVENNSTGNNSVNNTNSIIDSDGDGVPDNLDPCPVDNPDDSDFDGICDSEDICPVGNDNIDTDDDGVPDFCDVCPYDNPDDSDSDGICDFLEKCPGYNDNLDSDSDTIPDGCDICDGGDDLLDTDSDGVPDSCDLCPYDYFDDSDSDGVCDSDDVCEGGDDKVDTDGDGIPDFCDVLLPGTYSYSRIPVGGLKQLNGVVIDRTNSFLVAIERYNRILILNLHTSAYTFTDIHTGSENLYFEDIELSPDGEFALITGYSIGGSDDGGILVKVGMSEILNEPSNPSEAIFFIDTSVNSFIPDVFSSSVFASDGNIYLSSRNSGYPYIFYLFKLDADTGVLTQMGAETSTAGCQEITEVKNEYGEWGLLTVCGIGGYDAFYYTVVGGTGELRENLGNNLLGNSSSAKSHPSHDYALVVSWSGDNIHRFEGGQMNSSADAVDFSTRRLRKVVFEPSGERALILGRKMEISGAPFGDSFGVVMEYRHDFYSCVQPLTANCDITEVSIPDFGDPPFIAPDSTELTDASWRTDCSGGVIIGGYTSYSTDYGFIATFQLESGINCNWN
ncbi:MAG: hypothetical protein JXR95_09120 [Deltaproteobacteria bacterium]|nr:hypothetical protein [Deltaproteobacteria bacterium]